MPYLKTYQVTKLHQVSVSSIITNIIYVLNMGDNMNRDMHAREVVNIEISSYLQRLL